MPGLQEYIRTVVDFPAKGVRFRDITTLLAKPLVFRRAIGEMLDYCHKVNFDTIAAVDSRGFIFGSVLAYELGLPLVPVRHAGKLPAATVSAKYRSEYRESTLEVHRDAVSANNRVLIVDDLLATGGTALATAELFSKLSAEVSALLFLIDLPHLNGGQLLQKRGFNYRALLTFTATKTSQTDQTNTQPS